MCDVADELKELSDVADELTFLSKFRMNSLDEMADELNVLEERRAKALQNLTELHGQDTGKRKRTPDHQPPKVKY